MEHLNKLAANSTAQFSGIRFHPSAMRAESQLIIRSAYWVTGWPVYATIILLSCYEILLNNIWRLFSTTPTQVSSRLN